MPQVKLISPITRQEIRKIRVAAYCRVSSNSADQQNSYANQIRVYTSLIQRKKEWELVEIFADEGLSGMNAQNRTEFQRMIKDSYRKLFDTVLATGAVSESNYARVQSGNDHDITFPSEELNDKLRASAKKQGIKLIEGNIHSSDVFYRQPSDAKPAYWELLRDERGCLCVEMESFALFANAEVLGKNAACLLTISDSFVSPEITTAEQRQKSFTDMMKVALGAEY